MKTNILTDVLPSVTTSSEVTESILTLTKNICTHPHHVTAFLYGYVIIVTHPHGENIEAWQLRTAA